LQTFERLIGKKTAPCALLVLRTSDLTTDATTSVGTMNAQRFNMRIKMYKENNFPFGEKLHGSVLSMPGCHFSVAVVDDLSC
jgi:hypothetical protein